MGTLYVRDACGFREATSTDVLDEAHGIISRGFRRGAKVLHNPTKVQACLRLHLGHLGYEVFGAIYLDAHHRLIAMEDLFRGTLSSAQVHPREVVKSALTHNALSVIVYHNHPSGIPEPSAADDFITRRLKDALALVDIQLLDHLIVADTILSMAERGFL